MAGYGLTGDTAELDADAVDVIDRYLADVARALPGSAPMDAAVLAELRADLIEAAVGLTSQQPGPVAAAHAAIAEFGSIDTIAGAFRPELTTRRARRLGVILLASGPLVGGCWLAAALGSGSGAGSAWRWLPVMVAPLLIVGSPATAFTVATTGRLTRWLPTSSTLCGAVAAIAGAAAAAGDLLLLLGCAVLLALAVPAPSPLVVLAAAASLARLTFVARAAHSALSRRRDNRALVT